MTDPVTDNSRAPPSWRVAPVSPRSQWTGYLGVLPFAAALLGVAAAPSLELREFALRLGLAYGAASLTFVGAVHFGLVIARRLPGTFAVTLAATLPSLAGVAAILLGGQRGIALLTVSFGLFWLYESRRCGDLLPPAYLNLRRTLSLAVCALLALTMFAADSSGLR
mgnify:FL=1